MTGRHRPRTYRKNARIQGVGSKSVADSVALDPDLAKIVAAWKKLPKAIRKAMLALIS